MPGTVAETLGRVPADADMAIAVYRREDGTWGFVYSKMSVTELSFATLILQREIMSWMADCSG